MEEEVIETEEAANVMGEEAASEETTQEEGAEETTSEETTSEEGTEDNNGFLKRINKITWQREEQKRIAEAERQKAERLQATLDKLLEKETAEPEPKPEAPAGKPKIEDFETDAEFLEKLTDWKIEQREIAANQKRTAEQQKSDRQKAQDAFFENVKNTNMAGIKKYDDYEQVVFSLPGDVMNNELAAAMLETGAPEDIAYHLGKNPSVAEKISRMSPLKKAVELGKIEARLSIKEKKTTTAPPPINALKGKDGDIPDPDDLSPEEWIRLRNEGKI